jgi:hypothetical protein
MMTRPRMIPTLVALVLAAHAAAHAQATERIVLGEYFTATW